MTARKPYTVRWKEHGRPRQKSFATRREANQFRDYRAIDARAKAIGAAWPSPGDEQRERLAVLFSGPWLYDDGEPCCCDLKTSGGTCAKSGRQCTVSP